MTTANSIGLGATLAIVTYFGAVAANRILGAILDHYHPPQPPIYLGSIYADVLRDVLFPPDGGPDA